jgi:hypothetical protein
MRALTQQEVAAAWLYHNKFVARGLGAIEFYKSLSNFERRRVDEMIRDILSADASPDEMWTSPYFDGTRIAMGQV